MSHAECEHHGYDPGIVTDSAEAGRRSRALEQWIVLGASAGMAGLCWWWLIYSAQVTHASPVDAAGMAGMAAMAPELPAGAYFASALLMWALMMVAMMVPSVLPTVLLYKRFSARAAPERSLPGMIFAACYLLVWTAFSIVAAAVQTWFVKTDVIGHVALAFGSNRFAAFLLVASALYQLSPSKRACLAQCRAPEDYLARSWRPGL